VAPEDNPRRLALYHPWPQLSAGRINGWAKNMLLFFDGIALLAAPGFADSLMEDDKSIIRSLTEADLFYLLNPSTLMDNDSADRIMTFLIQA
jgi:hypothetical protein